jgi:hypothetical protein
MRLSFKSLVNQSVRANNSSTSGNIDRFHSDDHISRLVIGDCLKREKWIDELMGILFFFTTCFAQRMAREATRRAHSPADGENSTRPIHPSHYYWPPADTSENIATYPIKSSCRFKFVLAMREGNPEAQID